jgi:DNA-binding IclR family transcriptional regulator
MLERPAGSAPPNPARPPIAGSGPRSSPPTERVARIVELFAAEPERRLTLSAIVAELDLSIATAHSILNTLVERGWIVRRARDKTYALGPTLVAAGRAAGASIAGLTEVESAVEELSASLGLVCAASRVEGDEIVIVAQSRPAGVEDPATRVGQRIPDAAPFGASFIAWRDDHLVAAWLDRSPLGISAEERTLYRDVFAGIRARGYGVERFDALRTRLHDALVEFRDETMTNTLLERVREVYPLIGLREFLPDELERATLDIAMVHAPVFDATHTPVYNLTVHVRQSGVSSRRVAQLGAAVRDAAARCTLAIADLVATQA